MPFSFRIIWLFLNYFTCLIEVDCTWVSSSLFKFAAHDCAPGATSWYPVKIPVLHDTLMIPAYIVIISCILSLYVTCRCQIIKGLFSLRRDVSQILPNQYRQIDYHCAVAMLTMFATQWGFKAKRPTHSLSMTLSVLDGW